MRKNIMKYGMEYLNPSQLPEVHSRRTPVGVLFTIMNNWRVVNILQLREDICIWSKNVVYFPLKGVIVWIVIWDVICLHPTAILLW